MVTTRGVALISAILGALAACATTPPPSPFSTESSVLPLPDTIVKPGDNWQLPQLLRGPRIRYPDELRDCGVSGMVRVAFIVDTLGRVDDRAVRILESTHAEFSKVVRSHVPTQVFQPARMNAQASAALVRTWFRFTVGPAPASWTPDLMKCARFMSGAAAGSPGP